MSDRGTPVVLVVAGLDSGGGAGLAADVSAVAAAGGWAAPIVTAVTAQSTTGVARLEAVAEDLVRAQVDAVVADVEVRAVKVGMLGSAANVAVVSELIGAHRPGPVVVDPVLAASTGAGLVAGAGDEERDEYVKLVVERLLPCCDVVTPNLAEAAVLAGSDPGSVRDRSSMLDAAATIAARTGIGAVVVTGGHLDGDVVDLVWDDGVVTWLERRRIAATTTHGTGCVLSSTLAAHLAGGLGVVEATRAAGEATAAAIAHGLDHGRGPGPVDPLWGVRTREGAAERR